MKITYKNAAKLTKKF
jgi:hypothetical protein